MELISFDNENKGNYLDRMKYIIVLFISELATFLVYESLKVVIFYQ